MGCVLMGRRGRGAVVRAAPVFTAPALLLQPPVSQFTRAVTGRDAGWGFGGEQFLSRVTDGTIGKLGSSWFHGKHLFEHMLSLFKC